MLCEIEDVISEGFRAKRHMPYAHWLAYLIYMVVQPMPLAPIQEWSGTTREFPCYDAS
jgi:hypothetical protein